MNNDGKPVSGPAERDPALTNSAGAAPDTNTSDFKTPDQVAAADDLQPSAASAVSGLKSKATAAKTAVISRLGLQWPPTKKEFIVGGIALFLVLLSVMGLVLTVGRHTAVVAAPKPKSIVKAKVAPKPTTVPSTLTGLPVDPSVNQRPVTAVMVENSLDARPQSGLSQAGVVFEAIAEGGVTRFMAVYQDSTPDNVGPIRSARPYYVSWALGFDAGYAHVGGSPDGLADIRAWGVRDLDQFGNSGSYHRIDSRSAPHNVYTGIGTLMELETSKGYTSSTYTGFTRKTAAVSAAPTAKTIDFALSGYYYNPHFDYNPSTNSYGRSEAGAPHTDQNTGQQLAPNVVIAMVTPLGQGELDSSGAYYSDYTVVGSGAAYVFQDGVVTIGQWTKASNNASLAFTDSAGKPLALNPGQTWITAVNSTDRISYNP